MEPMYNLCNYQTLRPQDRGKNFRVVATNYDHIYSFEQRAISYKKMKQNL